MNQKGLWVIDKILHCVTIPLNFYCLHFGLAPQRDRIYSLKKKKKQPKGNCLNCPTTKLDFEFGTTKHKKNGRGESQSTFKFRTSNILSFDATR